MQNHGLITNVRKKDESNLINSHCVIANLFDSKGYKSYS